MFRSQKNTKTYAFQKQKIFVVGINYSPEKISTGLYTTELAEFCAKNGADVSVFTAQPYYPDWKIFVGYSKYWYEKSEEYSNPNVLRCPHYVPQNLTFLKRVLHHLSFAITLTPCLIWRCLKEKPNKIIVIAPSLLSAPIAIFASKFTRAKTWLHIQDLEVDAAAASGMMNSSSFLLKCAQRFEKWIYKKFDRISSISPHMVRALHDKGVPKSKLFELRNWADLECISCIKPENKRPEKFGISTKYTILYSGSLGRKQGLSIIPELAKQLRHRSDVSLVICGAGPYLIPLKDQCKNLPNVHFLPLQAREHFNDLLGAADIHLLPQIEGIDDTVLPSKLTNMLASGRAIVALTQPNSAISHEIKICGFSVPFGDVQQLCFYIEKLLNSKKLRDDLGINARDRAVEHWNKDIILTRFYDELTVEKNIQPETGNNLGTLRC